MVYCSSFVVTPVRWVVRPLLKTVIVKSTTILIENHTSINGVGALDNITDSSLVIREDYILNITSIWSIIYHNAALKRLRCYAKLIVIFPDNFRIIISSSYHMHKRNVQIRIQRIQCVFHISSQQKNDDTLFIYPIAAMLCYTCKMHSHKGCDIFILKLHDTTFRMVVNFAVNAKTPVVHCCVLVEYCSHVDNRSVHTSIHSQACIIISPPTSPNISW